MSELSNPKKADLLFLTLFNLLFKHILKFCAIYNF